MNRVAWCYMLEGTIAWPQSAAGRDVKSDHTTTMYGDVIEDAPLAEPDETLAGLNRLEKIAQASVWRKRIDDALDLTSCEVLRMLFSDNARRREDACLFVASQISAATGVTIWIALDECLAESGSIKVANHNHAAREQLLDLIRVTIKKANREVER